MKKGILLLSFVSCMSSATKGIGSCLENNHGFVYDVSGLKRYIDEYVIRSYFGINTLMFERDFREEVVQQALMYFESDLREIDEELRASFTEEEGQNFTIFLESALGQKVMQAASKVQSDVINLHNYLPRIIEMSINDVYGKRDRLIDEEDEDEDDCDGEEVVSFDEFIEVYTQEDEQPINAIDAYKYLIAYEGFTVVKFTATCCYRCDCCCDELTFERELRRQIDLNDNVLPIQKVVVDVVKYPQIKEYCAITFLPTTLVYRNGELINQSCTIFDSPLII